MAILGYKNSIQFKPALGLAAWLEERGLAGWLDIATDGLEASAKQRIAHEIETHFIEAVLVHIAAGEPELSAQAAALAELGDPQEAALNFRKSHLTESEAKTMKWIEWTAAKPLFSFWALLLDGVPFAGAALFYSYVRLNWNPQLIFETRWFAVFFLLAYIGFRLIPRLLYARTPRRNSLRRALALCQLTTQATVFPAIWLVVLVQHHSFSIFDAVFISYLYGFAMNPGFRIWKKLRKMGDERDALPPPAAAAS